MCEMHKKDDLRHMNSFTLLAISYLQNLLFSPTTSVGYKLQVHKFNKVAI